MQQGRSRRSKVRPPPSRSTRSTAELAACAGVLVRGGGVLSRSCPHRRLPIPIRRLFVGGHSVRHRVRRPASTKKRSRSAAAQVPHAAEPRSPSRRPKENAAVAQRHSDLGSRRGSGGGDWWVDSRRQGFAYSSVLLRPAREPKTSCTASSSSNAIRGAVQESTASCSAPKTRGPVAARRYPTDCAIPESAAA